MRKVIPSNVDSTQSVDDQTSFHVFVKAADLHITHLEVPFLFNNLLEANDAYVFNPSWAPFCEWTTFRDVSMGKVGDASTSEFLKYQHFLSLPLSLFPSPSPLSLSPSPMLSFSLYPPLRFRCMVISLFLNQPLSIQFNSIFLSLLFLFLSPSLSLSRKICLRNKS